MAKVNVLFDTVEKTMVTTIDGKAVDNVRAANFSLSYEEEGEFHCCITTAVEDDDNDIRTWTQLCASESVEAKAFEQTKASQFEGFVTGANKSKVESDIHRYFEKP